MKGWWMVLIFVAIFDDLPAQTTLGIPYIINYTKQTYKGSNQNWKIAQSSNGYIYIANNEGLISYDGVFWKTHPVTNRTIVRSVNIDPQDRIYIGAQDEFGYFEPDSTGNLSYKSLKEKIPPAYRHFEDVWDIVSAGNKVFFRTEKAIYLYDADTVTVHLPLFHWSYLGKLGDMIVAQNYGKGLMVWNSGEWKILSDLPFFSEEKVLSIEEGPASGDWLMATRNGIYIYNKNKLKPWEPASVHDWPKQQIFYLIKSADNRFYVGTKYAGIYVFSDQGKLIQHFTTNDGLQNNHVNYLFADRKLNIWLALENGIDVIAYRNAIKKILPGGKFDAAGYAVLKDFNHLYLGTTNGAYEVDLEDEKDISYHQKKMRLIPGTEGQIRNIQSAGNKVIISQHEGVKVYDPQTRQLHTPKVENGYWQFQPVIWNQQQAWVAGHYNGLSVWLQNPAGNFSKQFDVQTFNESARFIEVDNKQRVWVSHPYRGVYLFDSLSPRVKPLLMGVAEGLPSNMNNYVYKVNGRILFATQEGIYDYNDEEKKFQPAKYYQDLFSNVRVRYLKEDAMGNLWYIANKTLGVVDFSGGTGFHLLIPELEDKMVSGFDHIQPIDEQNVIIGAENGFTHLNYRAYKINPSEISTWLSKVVVNGDSLLYNGFGAVQPLYKLPFSHNNIFFQYSAPVYTSNENITYSFRLRGYQQEWSDWNTKNEKEFTNLPAGKYDFEVRSRTNIGSESAIVRFSFEIMPPWYATWIAYTIYAFIFVSVILFLYYRQHRKYQLAVKQHEEEQRRLKYLHELEMEKSEKELIALRNEKLQRELEEKNQALASNSLHLVHKEEVLAHVKENLKKVTTHSASEMAESELKRILKTLGEEEKSKETWEQFAIHFDTVHTNFTKQLLDKYPNLSTNEVKLCAYLRMNLSSKEIAKLLNISVRGVEISRYRLRKKLSLAKEQQLFHFLCSLTEE